MSTETIITQNPPSGQQIEASLGAVEQQIELCLARLEDERTNGKREFFQVGPYRIYPAEDGLHGFIDCWYVDVMGEGIPLISKMAACEGVAELLPNMLRQLDSIRRDGLPLQGGGVFYGTGAGL